MGSYKMGTAQFGRKNRIRGAALGWILLLLLSCSRGEQQNHHPLLASSWGGTAGGPIAGELEVQIFEDATRFPYPGAFVSLGDSGKVTATTDGQGIARFAGVNGPQDIHVFACSGCDADPNNPAIPLLYQVASLYQVNAKQVSIPIIPRDPTFALGTIQGKIFDVTRDEGVYMAAVDDLGKFIIVGPLGSTTYQVINEESPNPSPIFFIYTRDLDEWAAADPAGGKQGFGTVALLGTAINGAKQPQAGVQVAARYFSGVDAGRAYYFNDAGRIDPALSRTGSNGRFVFLRLVPNNDLFISAENLGVGVGARYVHLNANGTTVLSLPLLPLVERRVDLAGRVVGHRLDFREEERKGPLSSLNGGVEAATINFSGDPFNESLLSDSGAEIAGNYRSLGHLTANGRYVVVILAGRNFRPTYQELRLGDRSKFNYPLAAVSLSDLVSMVREKKGVPTAGLTTGTAEILGRIVKESGQLDPNGDPIMEPIPNAKVTVIDETGNAAATLAYFDDAGKVVTDPDPAVNRTFAKGGFLAFDLKPGLYTVIATDPAGNTIGRKSLPVYPNSTHLVELVNQPGTIGLGPLLGADLNPAPAVLFSLVGGGSPICPTPGVLEPACGFPKAGEYLVRLDRRSGGGDYTIPIAGSKRLLGLSTFRLSSDRSLNNVTFAAGLGPLAAGGNLTFDISFVPDPALVSTEGNMIFPANFTSRDVRAVLIGSVAARGEAFIGADAAAFSGLADPAFRAGSLRPEGALSYFVFATAQNGRGDVTRLFIQNLPDIPARQDLVFADPPKLLVPAPNQTVAMDGTHHRLVWAAPDAGPIDFYRVALLAPNGLRLWEAWVPGSQTEITFPAFPDGKGLDLLSPFADGQQLVWSVQAIRAPGLSIQEFTFKELSQRRISDTLALSSFILRRIQ